MSQIKLEICLNIMETVKQMTVLQIIGTYALLELLDYTIVNFCTIVRVQLQKTRLKYVGFYTVVP